MSKKNSKRRKELDSSLETELGLASSPPFYSARPHSQENMEDLSIPEQRNKIKNLSCNNFAEMRNLMEAQFVFIGKMSEKRLEDCLHARFRQSVPARSTPASEAAARGHSRAEDDSYLRGRPFFFQLRCSSGTR